MQFLSGLWLRRRVFRVLVTGMIAIAPPAAADPIVVTDGLVTVDSTDPSYFNIATDQFSILAVTGFDTLAFAFGPLRDCFFPTPCTTGMTFDTSAQVTRNPLNATTVSPGVHLNGVTYPSAVVDGHILIDGPPGVVPALEGGRESAGVIVQGMLLDALLIVYHDAARSGTPLLTAQLFGRGTLGVRFVSGLTEKGLVATDLSYRFGSDAAPAPIPEPGTLFLVAAGAACLLKRRAGGGP